MKKEYVYVIANVGIEHFNIAHICKNEKRARELFEKLRKEILKETERMGKKYQQDNDDYLDCLNNTTFDDQLDYLFEHPECIKYKLS